MFNKYSNFNFFKLLLALKAYFALFNILFKSIRVEDALWKHMNSRLVESLLIKNNLIKLNIYKWTVGGVEKERVWWWWNSYLEYNSAVETMRYFELFN